MDDDAGRRSIYWGMVDHIYFLRLVDKMSEIELGSLEFKSADFATCAVGDAQILSALMDAVCHNANRILRKKLSIAQRVWGHEDRDFGTMVYFDNEDAPHESTHTGILICLEEIGK